MNWFKNIKIAKKLLVSFACVLFLAITIGIVGIVGLMSMSRASNELYSAASPLYEMSIAMAGFQKARTYVTEAALYAGDSEALRELEIELHGAFDEFTANMDTYRESITGGYQAIWDDIMRSFNGVVKPGMETVLSDAKAGRDPYEIMLDMEAMDAASDVISDDLITLINIRDGAMDNTNT